MVQQALTRLAGITLSQMLPTQEFRSALGRLHLQTAHKILSVQQRPVRLAHALSHPPTAYEWFSRQQQPAETFDATLRLNRIREHISQGATMPPLLEEIFDESLRDFNLIRGGLFACGLALSIVAMTLHDALNSAEIRSRNGLQELRSGLAAYYESGDAATLAQIIEILNLTFTELQSIPLDQSLPTGDEPVEFVAGRDIHDIVAAARLIRPLAGHVDHYARSIARAALGSLALLFPPVLAEYPVPMLVRVVEEDLATDDPPNGQLFVRDLEPWPTDIVAVPVLEGLDDTKRQMHFGIRATLRALRSAGKASKDNE